MVQLRRHKEFPFKFFMYELRSKKPVNQDAVNPVSVKIRQLHVHHVPFKLSIL